ncbi:MAG TPA: hypothetical protein VE978_13860 [Chitinophagales bacterium]|nr:hypothetical protein [Chitinophagales bacterium]
MKNCTGTIRRLLKRSSIYFTLNYWNKKLADYWNERLNYESSEISWGSSKELIFVIIASLVAGVIAKLPFLLNTEPESFYQRNIGFIIFPILTTYFIWRKSLWVPLLVFAQPKWTRPTAGETRLSAVVSLCTAQVEPDQQQRGDQPNLSCCLPAHKHSEFGIGKIVREKVIKLSK